MVEGVTQNLVTGRLITPVTPAEHAQGLVNLLQGVTTSVLQGKPLPAYHPAKPKPKPKPKPKAKRVVRVVHPAPAKRPAHHPAVTYHPPVAAHTTPPVHHVTTPAPAPIHRPVAAAHGTAPDYTRALEVGLLALAAFAVLILVARRKRR